MLPPTVSITAKISRIRTRRGTSRAIKRIVTTLIAIRGSCRRPALAYRVSMRQHQLEEMTGLDLRWKALASRDAAADGTFVYGVTSTGVYCRPSCPSRRPRADRVRFFDTTTDARHAGFRACKRCRPDTVGFAEPGIEA